MAPSRIYFDNAATSWPKPDAVYRAVDDAMRRLGAPAGRSPYGEAVEVGRRVQACRGLVASVLGASDSRRVIFTHNGTDALNLALHGLLAGGGHVVTSTAEHNSALRPLAWLQEHSGVEATIVPCRDAGRVAPDDITKALRPDTRLVVLTHASNVTGAAQPIAAVGEIVRRHGALFLIDAAQTLGHVPFSIDEVSADLVAAPGHKGLLGPLGTGLLYIGEGVEERLSPTRQGGTGSRSDDERQPSVLPDRYESGNLNAPGILGLAAGIEYLQTVGIAAVHAHVGELTNQFCQAARVIPGVQLFSDRSSEHGVGPEQRNSVAGSGVVSLNLAGYDPQELAVLLDSAMGIQVRPGLHCAPRMHAELGTREHGGTVRFSFGVFNTADQVAMATTALAELATSSLS